MSEHHFVQGALEIRASSGSPGRVVGVILPAGRVADDRREVFVGSGITDPVVWRSLTP